MLIGMLCRTLWDFPMLVWLNITSVHAAAGITTFADDPLARLGHNFTIRNYSNPAVYLASHDSTVVRGRSVIPAAIQVKISQVKSIKLFIYALIHAP